METQSRLDVIRCRSQFPALNRKVGGRQAVFFDGPAGSQVPQRVIDAVSRYLAETNANHGGVFATSKESDAILDAAHGAVADLLGSTDPELVAFGANMTSLTFALSRALSRTWSAGDEILVTRLDHDANVTPWVLAARDAGARAQAVALRREDCTLDLEDLKSKLSSRTRLVAISAASNAVGTIQPVREIADLAHASGAQIFVDAVHYAPHALMDVTAWDCDFLACSAYKFFGPHVGVLWGKRSWMSKLPAYKVRPAPDDLPGRWMTGTQNHEGIAGTLAAVEYLASLGGTVLPDAPDRRAALQAAFREIRIYERDLCAHLLQGLRNLKGFRIWGIPEPERWDERVPTISITNERKSSLEIAEFLAGEGIFVWHGNFYALPVTESLGLEPGGMVRIGLLHYNTREEVDRLLEALAVLNS